MQTSDPIEFIDASGKLVSTSRDEFRRIILPREIEKAFNDRDALRSLVDSATKQRFYEEALGPARHLVEIEMPEREVEARLYLGNCLFGLGRLNEAENVYSDAIRTFGPNELIYTNLGMIYQQRGDLENAERAYWSALELNPNQRTALPYLLHLVQAKSGQTAVHSTLIRAASLPGAWRALAYQAFYKLHERQTEQAMDLYNEAIRKAERLTGEDLIDITEPLVRGGFWQQLADLLEPNYDPADHGFLLADKLLDAYLALGNLVRARSLLGRIRGMGSPSSETFLNAWDDKLSQIDGGSQSSTEAADS
jgi:tetratricopeptide (TPR) repeat protein